MGAVNGIINAIFGAIFAPFGGMPPVVGLCAISIVSGVAMIYVFKLTSNQGAISGLKDRIKAGFLEIKLFQNEPRIVGSAFLRILGSNFVYLRYTLAPMLFMMPLVILILVQCDMRYGVQPLRKGEEAVVTVKIDKHNHEALDGIKLEVPDGVKIVVDAIRIKDEGEANWKIRIEKEGDYTIKLKTGERETSLPLRARASAGPVAKAAVGGSVIESLLNPGLAPIDGKSPVKKIEIQYPSRQIKVFGAAPHWMITFFVVSMLFGFGMKGVFGVEI